MTSNIEFIGLDDPQYQSFLLRHLHGRANFSKNADPNFIPKEPRLLIGRWIECVIGEVLRKHNIAETKNIVRYSSPNQYGKPMIFYKEIDEILNKSDTALRVVEIKSSTSKTSYKSSIKQTQGNCEMLSQAFSTVHATSVIADCFFLDDSFGQMEGEGGLDLLRESGFTISEGINNLDKLLTENKEAIILREDDVNTLIETYGHPLKLEWESKLLKFSPILKG